MVHLFRCKVPYFKVLRNFFPIFRHIFSFWMFWNEASSSNITSSSSIKAFTPHFPDFFWPNQIRFSGSTVKIVFEKSDDQLRRGGRTRSLLASLGIKFKFPFVPARISHRIMTNGYFIQIPFRFYLCEALFLSLQVRLGALFH